MSFDRRLRNELHRDAERIDPEVERNLGAVEATGRHRPAIGWSILVATAIVLVLAMGLRIGATSNPAVGGSPTPSPSATASPLVSAETPAASFDAIAGTYSVTLDPAAPEVAQNRLGGRWTMSLASDGEVFLVPPASFGSGTSSLSGLAFTIAADRFRTNIFYNDFCSSIGTYTWSLANGRLAFAPLDDASAIRTTLLSTQPWLVGP